MFNASYNDPTVSHVDRVPSVSQKYPVRKRHSRSIFVGHSPDFMSHARATSLLFRAQK